MSVTIWVQRCSPEPAPAFVTADTVKGKETKCINQGSVLILSFLMVFSCSRVWLCHQHNFKDKASKTSKSFKCTLVFPLSNMSYGQCITAPEKCSCWGSDQSRIREMPGTGAEWSNVPWATLSTLIDCSSTAGNWYLCMQCFFFTYFCPSKEIPAARTVFTGINLRYQHVIIVLLRWSIREGLTIAEILASGIYKPQAGTPSKKG